MKKSSRLINRLNRGVYISFVIPALLLYTFFVILPVFIGLFYSLTNWNGLARSWKVVGIENYIKMFSDGRMRNSVFFTLRYTVMLVAGTVVLSLAIAMMLNSKIRAQTFYRTIFFFPAVLSLVVIGLMWNEILYRAGPRIGAALNIEILKTNILSNSGLAQFGILIVNLWQGLAIPTVLFIAGLQVIPNELYEAATIDGARSYHKFKSITLPFLIPIVNVVLVLAMKGGITLFDLARAMTDGGPGRATESISLLIYRNAFVENKYSFGVAQSVVLFLIIALVSSLQFSVLGKKEVGER
ncbi:MAG: sugar ABC transporter permease [Treponema sp.]|jgi:raffinose/stachyose/melibiose transport system permease protein|nr:sugar ABC transporter permease [Treponema sp.]